MRNHGLIRYETSLDGEDQMPHRPQNLYHYIQDEWINPRCKGSEERTKNFWGFNRKIPSSFYSGTTGIEPLDDTIHKINKSS